MFKLFIFSSLIIFSLSSVHTPAKAMNEESFFDYTPGWVGSLTVCIPQKKNLTRHPIQFEIDNGKKINNVWYKDAKTNQQIDWEFTSRFLGR